jgi:hypothetical protein
MAKSKSAGGSEQKQPKAESYRYPESESPLRPEAGTQSQFRKKKPPVTYRYDSSLSPSLEWELGLPSYLTPNSKRGVPRPRDNDGAAHRRSNLAGPTADALGRVACFAATPRSARASRGGPVGFPLRPLTRRSGLAEGR